MKQDTTHGVIRRSQVRETFRREFGKDTRGQKKTPTRGKGGRFVKGKR